MKLLVIGPKSFESIAIMNAAKARGHEVWRVSLREISLSVGEDGSAVIYRGKKLPKFDICLFRGVYPEMIKAKTLACHLKFCGTKIVDRVLSDGRYEFDKMFMSAVLAEKKLPVIKTYNFPTFAELARHLSRLPFPAVAKGIAGMRGRNVFLFRTNRGLKSFFAGGKKDVGKFLIQKRVAVEHYFRVFIVGSKVVGAMKRISLFSPRRRNVPLAERSAAVKLTPKLKRLALKAARALNIDIAGADIIFDGSRPKLLEVNRSPKFKRFVAVTGINVAKEIIMYLEKIYAKV